MPELPEVEIVKRELESKIIGNNIVKVFQSEKNLRLPIPQLSQLLGAKIISIKRRNKYVVCETEHSWILIHLGMTGRLTIESDDSLNKHTHYMIKLGDHKFLKYEDARRFGLIQIYSKEDYPESNQTPLLINLGVEPLSETFTPELIKELINKSKSSVKKVIMDSNIICGIGNIYASEILFLCKINPEEPCINLTDKDFKALHRHTIDTLNKSIKLGGSSISDYVHTNGVKGEMQNFYNTYGRDGEPCKVCSTSIEKVKVSGRYAFYCPKCQPLKNK